MLHAARSCRPSSPLPLSLALWTKTTLFVRVSPRTYVHCRICSVHVRVPLHKSVYVYNKLRLLTPPTTEKELEMVVCTKLVRWMAAAAVFLELWYAIVTGWLPISISPQVYQAILPVSYSFSWEYFDFQFVMIAFCRCHCMLSCVLE